MSSPKWPESKTIEDNETLGRERENLQRAVLNVSNINDPFCFLDNIMMSAARYTDLMVRSTHCIAQPTDIAKQWLYHLAHFWFSPKNKALRIMITETFQWWISSHPDGHHRSNDSLEIPPGPRERYTRKVMRIGSITIVRNNQVHNYNTRKSTLLHTLLFIPLCRTEIRQFSVNYQGPLFFKGYAIL